MRRSSVVTAVRWLKKSLPTGPSPNAADKSRGLFGNDLLTTPNGFIELSKQVEKASYDLVEDIVSKKSDGKGRPTVALVDDLSNVICSAADLAECARNIHSDLNFATAANDSMREFTNLVETLNTNTELFSVLKKSLEVEGKKLDDIDRRTLALLISDFEQSGVHLPDAERRQFVNLSNEIFEAAYDFASGTDVLSSVSPEEQKKYDISTNAIDTPFPFSPDAGTREFYFRRFYKPSDIQEKRIQQLVGARHELAQLTGHESFAHRSQLYSVLGTYESTKKFLLGITETFNDALEAELQLVRSTLAQRGQLNSDGKIHEWDVSFGTAMFRQQIFGFTGTLSKYFHLESLLFGFETIVERIYGIRFETSVPIAGEIWDGKVLKLDVFKEDAYLGAIYLDLEARPTKQTGDCHYTIRCAKQLADGSFQTPIVVLSLAVADPGASLENLTFAPSQAETFFHEMGHAMHSMLGRTRYQHTAGTRCPTDFAEVPSNLMECFFNDIRVLKLICRDAHGRSIEESEAEALIASRSIFSGLETLQQAHYSLFDLEVHGPEFAPAVAAGKITTTQLYHDLGVAAMPGILRTDDIAWPHRFSHLGPYGAKYYSYLVAKSAASMIWESLFIQNPYNRESGEIWAAVQAHGGEYPSADLLAKALGKTPTAADLSAALRSTYTTSMKLMEAAAENAQ
uniref:Peptidase_M3 domain-containing protein n=1 Tax=Panagrellus redivivus TaxID=6233 RepID=A0A7E4VSD8_PANRE